MKAILKHFSIRLRALCAAPFPLAVLLFSGAVSLFFWPGIVGPDGAGGFAGGFIGPGGNGGDSTAMMLLWLYTWSLMACVLVGGSVAGGGRGESFSVRALPALPIGPRARVIAEALVVLVFVVAVRIPFLVSGETPARILGLPTAFAGRELPRLEFAGHSLAGAVLMLPFLLVWLTPARTLHRWFLKPLGLLVLVLAALKLGLLAAPAPFAATCLVLATLALWAADREMKAPSIFFFLRRPAGPPDSRRRPGLDPEKRLRRDQLLRPLPAAAALLGLEALFLVQNQFVFLHRYGFYLESTLVFSFFFSLVVLRPMGCNLITPGFGTDGGFKAAWTVLPLRKEAVLRGVYLHGLIGMLALWAAVLGVNVLNNYLKTGTARLADIDGDPAGRLFIPFAAMAPCAAGGLAAAAAGDRGRGGISLAAAVLVNFGHFALLVAKAPLGVHTAILTALALAGGLPPLALLRAPALPTSAFPDSPNSAHPRGVKEPCPPQEEPS